MSFKLFVGNLSYDTREEQIRELFAPIGELLGVSIPIDRDTGRARGFAFVEVETPAQASAAIDQLNGREVDGRSVRVNGADDRPRATRTFGGRPSGGPGFRPRPKGSRRNARARKRSIW